MIIDPLLDIFRGKAITIPPMDGALKPNSTLDDAPILLSVEAPDNLVQLQETVYFSSGKSIHMLNTGKAIRECISPVAAMASNGKVIAVAELNGAVRVGEQQLAHFNCPTAMVFDGDDLLICNGSEKNSADKWATDLMQKGASGSVWRLSPDGAKKCLAQGMSFPTGVAIDGNNVIVSESWKHRLVSLSGQSVMSRMPGYPGRISTTPTGYFLSIFAPLNRLVEFVLQEDQYRTDMMAEIDPKHWIAPALQPAASFLEPLQSGGVKSMGVHKPWSPSRSYGLVVDLDQNFQPVNSYHSRANGRMHGVTSALWSKQGILVSAKGGNAILRLGAP